MATIRFYLKLYELKNCSQTAIAFMNGDTIRAINNKQSIGSETQE